MSNFCLQCGTSLVWRSIDGRQREQCPNCGWVIYLQLKVGAGVLIERDGKLLLVQRQYDPWQGSWYLPSGYVEADENPAHAAEREAFEETGLKVQVSGLVDAYYFDDDPRGNGLLLLYQCQEVGGAVENGEEARDIRFFDPAAIPSQLSGGGHAVAIRAWQLRNLSADER